MLASLGVVPIASAMPETAGTTPRDIVSNVEKLDAINEADEWTVMTENDTLRLEVEMLKVRGSFGVGKAVATVGGERAVTAEITFALGK